MNKKIANYYSHSQIWMYSACSLRYKFKYIDGFIAHSNSAPLVFGTTVHQALEAFYNSLSKKRISKFELLDTFTKDWEDNVKNAPVPVKFKTGKEKDNLCEMGLNTLEDYYKKHKNDSAPLIINDTPAVEIPFYLNLDNLPPIYGVIDLIIPNGKNKATIIDHKTAAKMYTPFQIDTNLQLPIYSMALDQMIKDGKLPKIKEHETGFNILIKKPKEKKCQIKLIKKKIKKNDKERFKHVIYNMHEGIQRELFIPSYGMQCSYCEYKEMCQKYKFGKIGGIK